jgi:magnesium transporter
MVRTVLENKTTGFHWLDLVSPTSDELEQIAQKYGLHPTSVQDCLDPEHLPKYEKIENITFIIVRAHDESALADADSVQELTRKLALFIGDGFLITIHRRDQRYLTTILEKWGRDPATRRNLLALILADILRNTAITYEQPIDRAFSKVESFEMETFKGGLGTRVIEDMYYLKREASLFRRMLKMTLDILPKLEAFKDHNAPAFQDLKETAESEYFYAEELLENVNNLLSLHISLASHRTNEVVRVLTLFSVFFMPLTFLVGIYGMNFRNMPELEMRYGYLGAWIGMVLVSAGIFLWFRRKGWLK